MGYAYRQAAPRIGSVPSGEHPENVASSVVHRGGPSRVEILPTRFVTSHTQPSFLGGAAESKRG